MGCRHLTVDTSLFHILDACCCLNLSVCKTFFKIHFIDYTISVVPFSPPLFPSVCMPPHPSILPPYFMSMGCTYKLFGSYISYITFNLLLSIFYLPFMLFIFCTFFPILPLPLPTDKPPCDLHFCDSVPVLVVSLVCFWFFR